jgi:hypothetical protein
LQSAPGQLSSTAFFRLPCGAAPKIEMALSVEKIRTVYSSVVGVGNINGRNCAWLYRDNLGLNLHGEHFLELEAKLPPYPQ